MPCARKQDVLDDSSNPMFAKIFGTIDDVVATIPLSAKVFFIVWCTRGSDNKLVAQES